MELDLDQFKQLCEYHYVKFDYVVDLYSTFVSDMGEKYVVGKNVIVGIIPEIGYPPSVNLSFEVEPASSNLRQVGYFNLSQYLKKNMH